LNGAKFNDTHYAVYFFQSSLTSSLQGSLVFLKHPALEHTQLTLFHVIQSVNMIYLLTAIGLTPGGSSTVHIYTQTIRRTIQNKQYTEQHNNFGRVRAVPRLGELYPGICHTIEEKAWKILSQGSQTVRIHTPNNKNT
jgi:uncharacterized integral membrane protein